MSAFDVESCAVMVASDWLKEMMELLDASAVDRTDPPEIDQRDGCRLCGLQGGNQMLARNRDGP